MRYEHARRWAVLITLAVVGCGQAPPGASSDNAAPAVVAPLVSTPIAPVRRLRRLSSREYDNVVRDLLGDATQPARSFVGDVYSNGYDNGSAGLAVQSDQATSYQVAAESLAAAAVARELPTLLGECNGEDAEACADSFLDGLAARAYRRPLTDTERQRLRDVFDEQRLLATATVSHPSSAGPNRRSSSLAAGAQAMLEVVLQSPQFLYREELGATDAGEGVTRLTSYEVASQLSFLITGSIPDDELWDAAKTGRLETTDDRRREATRLLGTPLARDTFRSFLHQWLTTDRLSTVTKDHAVYPGFDAAMAASMSGELDRFFDGLLSSGTGSLRELFTSPASYVDPTLAALYGAQTVGDGFQPVTLDANVRRGVLTRAGFLAVHAAADSSGPVARGVFVLETVLCSPIPPPPPNVPSPPPATDPSVMALTTRQRFDAHVGNATCAGCHRRIDGVGFGFEQFDGIGAFRTTENGQPVDATGRLVGTGETDGAFDGVTELTTRLAGSRRLRDCYAKQAYRYAMGQVEPGGDDLRWLTDSYDSDDRLTDVLIALITSPSFVTRSFEPDSLR